MKKLLSSFTSPCTIAINLDPSESLAKLEVEYAEQQKQMNEEYSLVRSRPKTIQRTITINDPNDQFKDDPNAPPAPIMRFDKDDAIKGTIVITPTSSTQHQGIRLELIGEIVMYFETKQTHKFTSLTKELAGAGTISKETSISFDFKNVQKEYESYRGINCDLRYYLRCTIVRNMFSIVKDQEFWVHVPQSVSPNKQPTDPGISMEVGLEGIVLLSIKYDQMFHEIGYGCIMGKLRFYLVNVKIDKAEVSLIKKETTWPQGEQELTQQETLKKFEIIDGTPAKDEVVPVRIYFSAIEPWKVTPTIPDDAPVEHRFSVKYFIHLALCDTKGRRFFKQRELILWRKNL